MNVSLVPTPYAMGWTTGVQFPAGAMMRLSFFVTVSRPALGPTQPI